MSHFLYNERCPRCSENGADKSGNNLAVYSDTHKYCFACGYHDRGGHCREIQGSFKHSG